MKIFLQFLFLIFVVSAHSIEVTISNNTLLVNNNPFYMKGICYHPVEIGKTKRNFINLEEDLLLMQEAGINTVRVYEPIDDIAVLDQFKKAGIKVVISFGYNQQLQSVSLPGENLRQVTSFGVIVSGNTG
jgi:hypothetical protein